MSDQYVGEIRMFAGNYAPEDWVFCDGQLMPIHENETLFSLIGTTYGGDGITNFAVPDLRGRVPIHNGHLNTTGTNYSLGERGGTEVVSLTLDHLPSHNHLANADSQGGTFVSPENAFWAASSINQYDNKANGTMNSSSLSKEGGHQPHNNMMPFLTVTFIIAIRGSYPVQE